VTGTVKLSNQSATLTTLSGELLTIKFYQVGDS